MLCIGYAKSVPDEGFRSIDRPEPLTRLRFAKPPSRTRGPQGEGEESEASTSVQRRYHPLCYSIRREKLQRHALNFGRLAPALRDRDQQIAAP